MEICLENFKCYHKLIRFKFKPGLTLIEGNSGVGKSTIFNAISWVLYGYPKNVLPNNIDLSKNERTYVSLTLLYDGLRVQRWKRSECLQVTIGEKTLTDSTAQKFIDRKYGPLNVWRSCSYLIQGERNVLLNLSLAERFDLLGYLAFGEDESLLDDYYSKLDTKITELSSLHKVRTSEFQNLRSDFNSKYSGKTFEHLQKEDIQNKFKQLQEDLNRYREREKLRSELLVRRNTLIQQLNNLPLEIRKPNTADETIDEIQTRINTFESELKYRNMVEQLQMYQSQIPKSFDLNKKVNPKAFTERDLILAQREESDYNSWISNCKKLRLNPENLEIIKSELKRIVDLRDQITLKLKINGLRSQLRPDFDSDLGIETLEQIRNKILELEISRSEAEKSRDILICPECEASLRYQNGKLLTATGKPVDSDLINNLTKELNNLNIKKQISEQQYRISLNVKSLESQLNLPLEKIPDLTESELNSQIERFNSLNKLKPVEKPSISSSEISIALNEEKEIQSIKTLLIKVDTLKDSIPKHLLDLNSRDWNSKSVTVKELSNKKSEILLYEERQKVLMENRSRLEKEINEIKIEPSNEAEIIRLDEALRNLYKQAECLKLQDKLNQTEEEINRCQKAIQQHIEVRKLIAEVEHSILEKLVTNINCYLNEICSELFDDPISVKLELFKTGKTTGRVRPNVHLKITYHGSEVESLNDLSFGEGDRLSLALTLVLYKVSGSNFLLIDEVLSSLHFAAKDSCCSVIRKVCTGNSLILNILHDATTGLFDDTIKL